jgi:hypothetical protein
MEIFRILRTVCPRENNWRPLDVIFSSLQNVKTFVEEKSFARYRIERAELDTFPTTWLLVKSVEK